MLSVTAQCGQNGPDGQCMASRYARAASSFWYGGTTKTHESIVRSDQRSVWFLEMRFNRTDQRYELTNDTSSVASTSGAWREI